MQFFSPTNARTAISAIILAALLLTPLVSYAQAPADDDELRGQSKALWKRASQKYTLAKWDEAIELFEEAYEVWPYPKILFNLCQAHRQKKSYERAIFFCRAYLRGAPDAPGRSQVVELIDEMERLAAKQDEISEKPPEGIETPPDDGPQTANTQGTSSTGSPSESRTPTSDTGPLTTATPGVRAWYHDRLGWGFAGGGGVVTAVGVVFLLDARSLDADADDAQDQIERVRLRDQADSRRKAGYVVTSVGIGLLAAGVIKLAIHQDRSDATGVTGLAFGPDWIGLRGRF